MGPADATTIDVFKGVHAVIFMVDPTRKWTLDYVTKHIASIPNGIDCVILFGKKDLNKLWTLSRSEIEQFMSMQPKNIRHIEISLADCYGMKELHSFFNVPFLRMKAKYLQQELDRAQREYEQSKVELDIFINHQNYDEFLMLLRTLREHKNQKHKSPSPSSPNMASAPTLKAKQTVTLSKDLPLIQEQHQKKEEQKKKKLNLKDKEEDIDSFKPSGGLNDDFFADLGDSKQPSDAIEDDKENEIEMNGHKESNGHSVENKEAYDRMPDLKNETETNGKLQSLMKLTIAQIESSESEEYDDEPLVLAATTKPIVQKIKSPKIIKPKVQKIEKENEERKDCENNEKALNELMEDLMEKQNENNEKHKSISPQSITDEQSENESEDEAEKKRKRKEKKRNEKRGKRIMILLSLMIVINNAWQWNGFFIFVSVFIVRINELIINAFAVCHNYNL